MRLLLVGLALTLSLTGADAVGAQAIESDSGLYLSPLDAPDRPSRFLKPADQLASLLRPVAPVAHEDSASRARGQLEHAELSFHAGRLTEALAILDGGSMPLDAADLVQLRRAEAAHGAGLAERARGELAGTSLASTSNRVILQRAAALADALGEHALAGDFWARSSRQPTWWTEKLKLVRGAASSFLRAGASGAAADMLAALVDGGAKADAAAELAALGAPTHYHAGLLAQLRGDGAAADRAYRAYLTAEPSGAFAAAAQRRLAQGTAPRGRGDSASSGWEAVRDLDTAAGYRAWIQANPASDRVPDARFFQALAHYRLDELDAALVIWQWQASVAEASADTRSRALYWAGKVLADSGDHDAARGLWRSAAAVRPTTYYAVRAADRLAGVVAWPEGGLAMPPPSIKPDEDAELDRWLARWAGGVGPDERELAAIRRAVLFAGLQLDRTAGAELDSLIETTGSPRTIYQAGRAAVEHGLWLSAVRAGARLARLAPERSSHDAPMAVRRLAFPVGYRDLVGRESARRDVGPLLMLALIRQESLFDRYALSSADARGLTQVIPSTGRELAKAFGRDDFSPDELFDPNVSVAFGARYLSGQLKHFQGDVFRAVAAYNAGGGAAGRWARGTSDPDVFVESIAYSETREYVKSVYQHHAAYRGLVDR